MSKTYNLNIIVDETFEISIKDILSYIAKDSKNRATLFHTTLIAKINNLSSFPYKYRKSFHYDNDKVRDLIFKGYTIPYFIDEQKETIIILDIFKWMNK